MKKFAILAALFLTVPTVSFARHPHVVISAGFNSGCYQPRHYGYSPFYGSSVYFGPSVYYAPSAYYSPRPVYRASRYYVQGDSSPDAEVQRALKQRGYYRGPIDGDIGPASRAAIREYQGDRGLRVTGRVDGSLLRSLGV